MTDDEPADCDAPSTVGQWTGCRIVFLAGLALTAMSLSAGFIWASQGEIARVYLAGFTSWTGYIIAHYGDTGVFVDDVDGLSDSGAVSTLEADDRAQSTPGSSTSASSSVTESIRDILPEESWRAGGFLAGIVILVIGIALTAWYVRQADFVLGAVGNGVFLAGYATAHYFNSSSGHFL